MNYTPYLKEMGTLKKKSLFHGLGVMSGGSLDLGEEC
jgi:hypothetical protein